MSIGKNIAKYRKALSLTQEELGEQLGVTNQAVSKWESEVSMPDIMLLPRIAFVLGVSLEDIYGIEKESKEESVSADNFPTFCHNKLHELFFYNTRMRFTNVDNSDEAQFEYQRKKLKDGCRIGCLSNDKGAVVLTDDFAFVYCDYKSLGSEGIIYQHRHNNYSLMCLTDNNFRKVFFYQYTNAIQRSKNENSDFSFEEIMQGCNLSEEGTISALQLLCESNINETYIDQKTKEKKYVFKISNALYVLAIYKLVNLLSNDPVWLVVRDTSMLSDYAF